MPVGATCSKLLARYKFVARRSPTAEHQAHSPLDSEQRHARARQGFDSEVVVGADVQRIVIA